MVWFKRAMHTRIILAAILALGTAATHSAWAQPPRLYAPDGTYLGNLSTRSEQHIKSARPLWQPLFSRQHQQSLRKIWEPLLTG